VPRSPQDQIIRALLSNNSRDEFAVVVHEMMQSDPAEVIAILVTTLANCYDTIGPEDEDWRAKMSREYHEEGLDR
jgi:hypothetical protein